jgi:hypothetical protein
MKHTVTLTIASLLSLLFTTFHLADDIVRGMSPGGLSNLLVVIVWVVWLYATLMLAERRSGYVIVLVMSVLASGLPVIHMANKGGAVSARIAESSGAFFFAWTPRARRDRSLLRHPVGARTVEPAAAQARSIAG